MFANETEHPILPSAQSGDVALRAAERCQESSSPEFQELRKGKGAHTRMVFEALKRNIPTREGGFPDSPYNITVEEEEEAEAAA